MTLNQLSVFVENKPGTLQILTDILAEHNINMRALSLAEASEFGIVRIIVDDARKAIHGAFESCLAGLYFLDNPAVHSIAPV